MGLHKVQYSIRELLLGVAAVALTLGLALWLGALLATLLGCLLAVYLASFLLARRIRAILALASVGFCALPWLGVRGESFVYPGCGTPLPCIHWSLESSAARALYTLLEGLYAVAELPLNLICLPIWEYEGPILLDGVGRVEAFVVFVFWLGLAICFGAAAAARKRCPGQKARLRSGQGKSAGGAGP